MNNKRQSLWVKLACDYFDDERILLVGTEAELLFVRGLAWAKRQNDGKVGNGALVRLGMGLHSPVDSALTLARAGLWVQTPDGWQIANWAAWQSGTEHTTKRSEAGSVGNHRRWHTDRLSPDCRWCIAEASPDHRTGIADAIQEKEKEKEKENTSRRTATLHADDFNAWWQMWPKKVARLAALKAYTKARRTTEADVLLAAAQRVAVEWAAMDNDRRQYVPYPASWLNAERWLDDVQPDSGAVPIRPVWVANDDCELCEGLGWCVVDEATNTFGPCECRSQP